MDKKYYYRMLGLTQEVTPKQIKAAYEQRMLKLNSPDYNDDPEYARRKKEQATTAYKVLTGNAPPMSRQQKKMRFEKFKDSIESEEGNENRNHASFKQEAKKFRKAPSNTHVFADVLGGANKTAAKKTSSGIMISVAIVAISVIIGLVTSFVEINDEYDYSPTFAEEESVEIDSIQAFASEFDYLGGLDTSTIENYSSEADLQTGTDEYGGGETFDNMLNIIYVLGIYDASGFFDYITGIEDYYYEYDDAACAATLIEWMGAPSLEDIAGSTNPYTGEPILSYADYLRYLERLIYEY